MRKLFKLILGVIGNLDWAVAIVLAILFAVGGMVGHIPATAVASGTLGVLGLLSFSALRDRGRVARIQSLVSKLDIQFSVLAEADVLLRDKKETGIARVFPQTDTFDWTPYIQGARNVTMIKLRHNFTDFSGNYAALEAVLAGGGSVTLVFADPRSTAMWLRNREEPTPLQTQQRPTGVEVFNQLQDLSEVLFRINNWKHNLAQKGIDVSRLSLLLNPHYPGQAFYVFDNIICCHGYPYLQRGIYAPAFMFTDPTTHVHRFLRDSIRLIVDGCTPLAEALDEIKQMHEIGHLSDQYLKRTMLVMQEVVKS